MLTFPQVTEAFLFMTMRKETNLLFQHKQQFESINTYCDKRVNMSFKDDYFPAEETVPKIGLSQIKKSKKETVKGPNIGRGLNFLASSFNFTLNKI